MFDKKIPSSAYEDFQKKLDNRDAEIDNLKKHIREQTEADLLFISMKLIYNLLNDKKLNDLKDLIPVQSLLKQTLQRIEMGIQE